MPEISRFLGIIISMHYREHNPPHFHAKYGDYEITVDIESGLVSGKFPRRAQNLVLDWYLLHRKELIEDWQLSTQGKALNKIQPLE